MTRITSGGWFGLAGGTDEDRSVGVKGPRSSAGSVKVAVPSGRTIGASLVGAKAGATGSTGGDIHVHVAGSVVTENQLVDVVRDAAITRQRTTGRPFIPAV